MREKLRHHIGSDVGADILAAIIAVIVGMAVGYIILLVSNAAQSGEAFKTILTSGISSRKSMGQVLYFAAPIIMTGLSVGFTLRTGLFNIGASGQFITGAYAAILVGVKLDFLPGVLHCLAALIAAMAAGAIWGFIPGILKAKWNVNEVIACIMMNYVGMYLVNFLIVRTAYDSLRNQSMKVANSTNLPKLGLDTLFPGSSVNSGIFVAIIMAVIIYVVLEKTKFGFEIKAIGFNRDSARYAGMNEERGIILSMVIAGSLAGLGGAIMYLSGAGNRIDVVDVLAAEGFNGIPVALLGLNNPLGIIFAGLLIAYLNVGGFNMQLFNFAPQVIEIMIAIIIYFSAFTLLLKEFLQRVRKQRKLAETETAAGEKEGDTK